VTVSNDEPFPIIVPSAELVAVVHHGDVPAAAPDELVPYVRAARHTDDETIADWLLTEDTLAFADVEIPMRYAQWRATWERSWILDPLSSIERLVSAARQFEVSAPHGTLLERVLDPGTTGPAGDVIHATLDPAEAQRLAAVIESLRDAIADRGHSGFGFVDATPGRRRVGLARAWSGQDGPETLVADHRVSVSIDPTHGLSVAAIDQRGAVQQVRGVHEVEISGDTVEARSADATLSLDLHSGRVLSWLMPGCTMWRVRQVPEVLVWARTFAGLVECAEVATAIDRHVLLTSLRLSESDGDAGPGRTQRPRRLESSCDQEQ
jgi:hypothetical protein